MFCSNNFITFFLSLFEKFSSKLLYSKFFRKVSYPDLVQKNYSKSLFQKFFVYFFKIFYVKIFCLCFFDSHFFGGDHTLMPARILTAERGRARGSEDRGRKSTARWLPCGRP
jgi:hypothetical protein